MTNMTEKIIQSRKALLAGAPESRRLSDVAEGGCGVLGFASNIPVAGCHVLAASRQMHNRGNGKGGGVALVGLDPDQVRVDRSVLRSHYLLQIALLDSRALSEIENHFIEPFFDINQAYLLEHIPDYRDIAGLPVRPPDVYRYFVRVKDMVLDQFAFEKDLSELSRRSIEDEFVYQNSYQLNRQFYASLGEKRAFVLSHGRNLSVLKIVGYAEDVVEYYGLQNQKAHVWISHQRYPTKGKVWHPGGAHPFVGLNEALVHNGDFANYHAVSEYLRQRNIDQLFLTDTEVSVQLFDLWDRVYRYPLEITLEAMAPTTEYDFAMLPDEKKSLYEAVQRAHIHGSPDGPWFFIVARSSPGAELEEVESDRYELLGITDTSMLRPQVFALYENLNERDPVQIGLIASERQAINACLRSMAAEDSRIQPLADRYWVARGGSYTDGGAFRYAVEISGSTPGGQTATLLCTNKFGKAIKLNPNQRQVNPGNIDYKNNLLSFQNEWKNLALISFDDGGAASFWRWLRPKLSQLDWSELDWGIAWLVDFASTGDDEWEFSHTTLNLLHDRQYDPGTKKRASILGIVDRSLVRMFNSAPLIGRDLPHHKVLRMTWSNRYSLVSRGFPDQPGNRSQPDRLPAVLLIDALDFPPEGDESVARWIVRAYENGWRRIIGYNWRGGRFAGCGIGADSDDLQIDCYGDVGDYAASGLDGASLTIHGDGQDQLGQIMKRGKLIIHGDAGQTFLYGAKGGEAYVLGSVAGRPLINAVGQPRAVINGVCLDYLAESFMAGDPLDGGGFVILNGVTYNDEGNLVEHETPYPGGNLFSLASGGAIYVRDPHRKIAEEQLNGGVFTQLSPADWLLIEPYLRENERLFDISVNMLLTSDGERRHPADVYRKVQVRGTSVLHGS